MNWPKIVEKTVGAVRHVLDKWMPTKGFPVGFAVVLYNPEAEPDKRWFHEVRVVIDSHELPDLHDEKIKERIADVNQFLAIGVKKILEGEIDDNETNISGTFQIPGEKGRG